MKRDTLIEVQKLELQLNTKPVSYIYAMTMNKMVKKLRKFFTTSDHVSKPKCIPILFPIYVSYNLTTSIMYDVICLLHLLLKMIDIVHGWILSGRIHQMDDACLFRY